MASPPGHQEAELHSHLLQLRCHAWGRLSVTGAPGSGGVGPRVLIQTWTGRPEVRGHGVSACVPEELQAGSSDPGGRRPRLQPRRSRARPDGSW